MNCSLTPGDLKYSLGAFQREDFGEVMTFPFLVAWAHGRFSRHILHLVHLLDINNEICLNRCFKIH